MKFFWKYCFPPVYGLLVYFTIRLLLDSVTNMKFWERRWTLNAGEMAVSMILGTVALYVFRQLFRYFDSHWGLKFSYRRIAKELFYVFLANLILVNATGTPMAAVTDDGLQWYDLVDLNTVPLLYAIIYYGIVRSSSFLQAYVANKLLLEKITNNHLESELKFLKAQYHPHFLFNALNTIYFQIDDSREEAKKSIEKFSGLLRYQLYDQQRMVPVTQEIQYLENYIQLQKTRASEKLELNLQLDDGLNGQMIYPLLFMPLVENAFKYVGGAYKINIIVQAEQNYITLRVANSVSQYQVPVKEGGIGLENLRRRLELLYPGKHRFQTGRTNQEFTADLSIQFDTAYDRD